MDGIRGRRMLLGGATGMLIAAVGLNCFGPASFAVLGDALLFRPGQGFPESSRWSGYAALAGLVFGLAGAVAIGGFFAGGGRQRLTLRGVGITVLIGLATAVGGAGIATAAARQLASFSVMAASATAPGIEDAKAIVEQARGPARVGWGAIMVSAVLWVVLACVNPGGKQQNDPAGLAARLAGGASIFASVAFGLSYGGTWFPLGQLQGILTDGGLVRPDQFATLLSRVLIFCQLAGLLLALQGVLLVVLAVVWDRSRAAADVAG